MLFRSVKAWEHVKHNALAFEICTIDLLEFRGYKRIARGFLTHRRDVAASVARGSFKINCLHISYNFKQIKHVAK